VRWWCVTILDHIPDPRAIEAILPLLDDPVPRVRRNTAHALGCVLCKPEWCGILDPAALAKLEHRAANDENARVRRDATIALFQLATAQAS
jgi:HEAT repeat protein